MDTLINRLKQEGVSKVRRDALHRLRELYNNAKHDPAAPVRLKGAIDTVGGARTELAALAASGIGATSAQVSATLSRVLWVLAWDVYVGGTTEVSTIRSQPISISYGSTAWPGTLAPPGFGSDHLFQVRMVLLRTMGPVSLSKAAKWRLPRCSSKAARSS